MVVVAAVEAGRRCALGCECADCSASLAKARRELTPVEMRRRYACQFADESADVEVMFWVDTYARHIRGGRINPMRAGMKYLQVANIGDSVLNVAAAERVKRIENEARARGARRG